MKLTKTGDFPYEKFELTLVARELSVKMRFPGNFKNKIKKEAPVDTLSRMKVQDNFISKGQRSYVLIGNELKKNIYSICNLSEAILILGVVKTTL